MTSVKEYFIHIQQSSFNTKCHRVVVLFTPSQPCLGFALRLQSFAFRRSRQGAGRQWILIITADIARAAPSLDGEGWDGVISDLKLYNSNTAFIKQQNQ